MSTIKKERSFGFKKVRDVASPVGAAGGWYLLSLPENTMLPYEGFKLIPLGLKFYMREGYEIHIHLMPLAPAVMAWEVNAPTVIHCRSTEEAQILLWSEKTTLLKAGTRIARMKLIKCETSKAEEVTETRWNH